MWVWDTSSLSLVLLLIRSLGSIDWSPNDWFVSYSSLCFITCMFCLNWIHVIREERTIGLTPQNSKERGEKYEIWFLSPSLCVSIVYCTFFLLLRLLSIVETKRRRRRRRRGREGRRSSVFFVFSRSKSKEKETLAFLSLFLFLTKLIGNVCVFCVHDRIFSSFTHTQRERERETDRPIDRQRKREKKLNLRRFVQTTLIR